MQWAVGCCLFCFFALYLFCFFPPRLLILHLSMLPSCRVLLRTSCCLVITVWLFPSFLFLPCGWSLLQPLCSLFLSLSHSVVLLHCCCISVAAIILIFFSFISFLEGRSFAYFIWLAYFFFSRQTCHSPLCPPCALPWFSAAPVYSSVIGQWVSVLFVCSCVS